MVLTPSTMLPIGTPAPHFSLPDTQGQQISIDDFTEDKGLLVIFMCNHCPYVKHIESGLATVAKKIQDLGIDVVGINANDVDKYPEDAPELMAKTSKRLGYSFPYLYDADQQVAKDYHAACTPDFFLFDEHKRLFYRGQFDDSRPSNNIPVTGETLLAAIHAMISGQQFDQQKPSLGCNIKWKPGNAPEYFAA